MVQQDNTLKKIWEQKQIPIIVRRGGGEKILVRLPYSSNNKVWLKNGRRNEPNWDATKFRWELPNAWFDDTVKRLLKKFRYVYVIQPFRALEKCAPACWNAAGIECECSCMGVNHGSGCSTGRWYEISETCAVKWGALEFHYRLLKEKIS